ncbi:MAG TPA: Ig-like domain-containing protein [Polyangia bacterium]|nr:Ig-like domain-containing protein [Polyangia bacterium]
MRLVKIIVLILTAAGLTAAVTGAQAPALDLPNRIPEAAPYVTAEARLMPPPYEEYWQTQNHPGQCQTCHARIFDEWNGSMMSNSWRDPVWRAAFLLLSRAVSTDGDCGTPSPPDGTPKAQHNPFAQHGVCASQFDLGTKPYTVARAGSLLDGFCSRCHMPTNYIDNVPLRTVTVDKRTGIESAPVDPHFNPTGDNGTGLAFATLDAQLRNTESGKTGIFCAVCHSYAATRDTPFHNYPRGGLEYQPALGTDDRADILGPRRQDMFAVADSSKRNLGYSIGAGAYRLSAHAIVVGERFGPLAANPSPRPEDDNTGSVFGQVIPYQQMDAAKHKGFHQAMYVRSEMCAACHDVTNALPIKNQLGRWVGGFPIERTYTEWANSRYADRPGNRRFDPAFKRDCQSCHMQQDYGQPGTAQTLYRDGHPLPIPSAPVATDGKPRPSFTHHFVGGNALVPRLIGKDVDPSGNVAPYPELSTFSFSSADHASPYSRALWMHTDRKGAYAQQARLAWDRLRHVVALDADGPASVAAGSSAPLTITVANTGSGHDFPTGFPEGRIAWLAVHAYDLATGDELPISDSHWNRTSLGVGNLTGQELEDPEFPGCHWKLPPGSADPFAVQFKAVASLGNGCPTLDLPYAAPLNLVTDKITGLPIDQRGRIIDAVTNPRGLPQFTDSNGNGDLFDDSFLRDTRLKPMPHAQALAKVDRYAVVVPPGSVGPIAVSAAVYYQSVEAIVAAKFLGNMADTNGDMVLQPCVLGGLCDGRQPHTEPPVVEGAPPVPMAVHSWTMTVSGAAPDRQTPTVTTYPVPGATQVYDDVVVKVSFSKPVRPVTGQLFTLSDADGAVVPAWVDQIGAGTYGLFPNAIHLKKGGRYIARLAAGVCDFASNCTTQDLFWPFVVASDPEKATGDTSVPPGFGAATAPLLVHSVSESPRTGSSTASSTAPSAGKHRRRSSAPSRRM